MIRETQQSEKAYKDGIKGGNPKLLNTLNLTLIPPVNPEAEAEAEAEAEQNRAHGKSVLSCQGDSQNDNDTQAKIDYFAESGIKVELARENNGASLQAKYLVFPLDQIRTCWSHAVGEDRRNVLKGPILAFFYALLKQGFSGNPHKSAGPVRKITCVRCLHNPLDDPKRCPDCAGVGYWLVDDTDARVPIETPAPPTERKRDAGDATPIGDVIIDMIQENEQEKEPPAPEDQEGTDGPPDPDDSPGMGLV